ncbi:Leucine-rich repeat-containing protein 42 [Argiope bruennichi]|nr:Leucine-rich repeat-containing protein 42 [Argiope bruennichi]
MFNKGPKNVEYLDLSENMFTDDIIAGLSVFQKLQCLDLSGSNLSSKGIRNLERNCSLKLSSSETESFIHPVGTKGWAIPLIEKWCDVCRLRRKNRDIKKQNLYYSKKRFLMAKKSISESSSTIQFSPIKLVFIRQTLIEEKVNDKFAYPNVSKSLPEKVTVSYQKAIEEDIFAQYI